MPLILPGNVASATADAGYTVANSCRFDKGDTAYMHKTTSGGNRKTWTFSTWIKRISLGTQVTFCPIQANTSNYNIMAIQFVAGNEIDIWDYNGGISAQIKTNRKFRDVGAWYHVVLAVDTTDSTANNRMRLYINGKEERGVGGYGTDTMPAEDYTFNINVADKSLKLGVYDYGSLSSPADSYFAETVFIDGTQYAASDFGEFSEESPTIWMPKDPSELTFGTNGFYLDYEDSANLGNDANGGTDLTEVSLAATDQMTDTPTNNYTTLNPLYAPTSNPPTYSEGNLKSVTNTTSGEYGWGGATTIGVTSGKWYCEAKATVSGTSRSAIGVHYDPAEGARDNSYSVNEDYAWGYHSETGVLENDNATVWDGNAYVTDDIIGIYLDLDNHKLYIAKNGTLENSGTGASLTTGKTYHFYQEDVTGGTDHSTFEFNFGAGSSWAVSSGNADANGYGNFEYDPSAGSFDSASKDFYALNTKNLAEFG